jgi:GT2 family glycosyltransferase/2-polyprenyl-3-methyl-5-hydroxy-6-metoxy-1,4-benzoquinol methylase/glycosyltransferase involved in cell wall biosynthesis
MHMRNGVSGYSTNKAYDGAVDLSVKNNSHTKMFDFIADDCHGHRRRILEVGCATGFFGAVLKEHGHEVWGVEVSPQAAAVARERLDHVYVGTIEDFLASEEITDVVFDYIIYGDVLEHLVDPTQVLQQCQRIQAPEGKVVASIPNIAHLAVRLLLLEGRWEYSPLGILDNTHLRFFTRTSIVEMFSTAGFTVTSMDAVRLSMDEVDSQCNMHINRALLSAIPPFLDDDEQDVFQYVIVAKKATDAGFVDQNTRFLPENSLRILCLLPKIDSSLSDLRIANPLHKWRQKYNGMVRIKDMYTDNDEELRWADIVVIQRETNKNILESIKYAHKIGKKVVFDIDDLLTNMPYFLTSYARNLQENIPYLDKTLREADAITVTTKNLFDKMKRYNERVYIIPNGSATKSTPISHYDGNVINIVVASSDTIRVDFIVSSIRQLMADPDLHLRLIGIGPPGKYLADAGLVVECHEHMPYDQFKSFIASLDNTIGIIPLDDSVFNSCKSAIKFVDYSLAGIPTVCSAVAPYIDVMEHGITGILVENEVDTWYREVKRLALSAAERNKLATAARHYCLANFSLDKMVDAWQEVFAIMKTIDHEGHIEDKHLANVKAQVADKDRLMAAWIIDKDRHIADLKRHTANLEEKIANLEGAIIDKDRHIGNLDRQILDKDHHIGNLDRQTLDKDHHIGNLDRQILDKDRHITNIETQLHRVEPQLYLAESEVHTLKRSWSYRVGRVLVFPASLLKIGLRYLRGPRMTPSLPETAALMLSRLEPTQEALKGMGVVYQALSVKPRISILMPVYNTPPAVLRETLDSVLKQVYQEWELCLADDGSTNQETLAVLQEYAKKETTRIRLAYLQGNSGIAMASNTAADLATGEFVALLDHDDLLTPDALLEVARRLEEVPDADLLYSDEDKVTMDGMVEQPFHKPDFSPELLLANNYICHFTTIRRSVFEHVGRFREGFDGSQDYDLVLRVTEVARRVEHIAKILYHWRMIPGSTAVNADAKGGPWRESSRQALRAAIERRGWEADVMNGIAPSTYRVKFAVDVTQHVTIIIPIKDKIDLLHKCVASILAHTQHPSYEILVISNNSEQEETYAYLDKARRDGILRFLRHDIPFNYAALNNFAVPNCKSPYLLFLNNDTEVDSDGWLTSMLEFVQQKDIGAVGAKLLYPDGSVQHAGVVLGIKGVANHSHKGTPEGSHGYFGQVNTLRNYSAVTGACLMTRRDVFEQVGGFNETLAVAFNDIDFCLEVRKAGYRIVYTPYARLFHVESASRGNDDTHEKVKRFQAEISFMIQKWGASLYADPYYNPNLTLWREDFSLKTATEKERQKPEFDSA